MGLAAFNQMRRHRQARIKEELSRRTVKELQEIARKKGIDPGNLRKAELVELLSNGR